jgi:Transposase, Mutator family
VLTDLRNRGVEDVFVVVVVCDRLKGLPEVAGNAWPAAIVQTCIIHLIRNTFRLASKRDWDVLKRGTRPICTAARWPARPSSATTPDPLACADGAAGAGVPPGSELLRRGQRHPGAELCWQAGQGPAGVLAESPWPCEPSHRADRTAHPHRGWQEAPARRFGDPRVMALTGALALTLFSTCGVTNKSLRALTARLLGTGYSSSQMTYDRCAACASTA